jgi:hypothetical protein
LKLAGTQTVTATDTANGSVQSSGTTAVSPAAASTLILSGYPSPTTAGAAHPLTVTAQDAYGNTATGYRGTVAFSSTDAQAQLPAAYTFTSADAGSHTFSATLETAGTQSLTANDTQDGLSGSQTAITVTGQPSQWQQTTVADFSAGTLSGTILTNTSGGEVQLAPSFQDDFNGSALSSAWTVNSWASAGGGPSVDVNGATTGVSLGALPTGFHVYEVRPVSGGFQFCVDGVLQTTIAGTFPPGTPLRMALSAYWGAPQPSLQADWVRVANYPPSGTFLSSVFDAGRAATWGTASWVATVPSGTTLTVQTRSGNTPTPDSTWSAWSAVSNGGTVSSPAGQYLQYRLVFTTTDPGLTPVLFSIDFNWS